MKKKLFLFLALSSFQALANAADLIEVFNQALLCDPIYQQAISQRLSTREGLPISIASLLPNMYVTYNPAISRSGYSGSNYDAVIPIAGTPSFLQ
ncbi:MAG: hypothetical protein ACYC0J_10145, partial [Gammaproteobacteria bacterium]